MPCRYHRPRAGARLIGLLVGLQVAVCATAFAASEQAELSAEQSHYRQLSLLLIVSVGVAPDFLDHLLRQAEQVPGLADLPPFQVDDFQTPLNRIIDPPAVLASAARLFAYTRDNEARIRDEMTRLVIDHPELISALDADSITEEAIIIRSSLAGSMEFSGVASSNGHAADLQAYQNQTLYLRNMMEYRAFREDLAAVTDSALRDTVGRLDAYQRMLDDNTTLDGFSRRMAAIELMYLQITGKPPKPPPMPGEELIDAESQVR